MPFQTPTQTHLGDLGLHPLLQPADAVLLLYELRRQAGHLVPRVVVGGAVTVRLDASAAVAPRSAAVTHTAASAVGRVLGIPRLSGVARRGVGVGSCQQRWGLAVESRGVGFGRRCCKATGGLERGW